MAEEEISAGGVDIKVGEKTTGEKAVEAIPIYGNFVKAKEAMGDSGETGGASALSSEGSALISGLTEAGQGLVMDPLGWLVGQGLNFLISVVQPLEDAIHANRDALRRQILFQESDDLPVGVDERAP